MEAFDIPITYLLPVSGLALADIDKNRETRIDIVHFPRINDCI